MKFVALGIFIKLVLGLYGLGSIFLMDLLTYCMGMKVMFCVAWLTVQDSIRSDSVIKN